MTAMSADVERPGMPATTSGKATASLVLGLFSFCIPVLLSIPALILGIMSLSDISRSQERLKGRGLAITGIVFSALSIIVSPVLIVIALLLPAVQKVREAANRAKSQNNLKQLALAYHNYASSYRDQLPTTISDQNNTPLLSWRVNLLPYVEEDRLYRQFKLDEAWDSASNRPLLNPRPKTFNDPALVNPDLTVTAYRTFVGPGTLFSDPGYKTPYTIGGIPDGTSNTILIVEASTAVPWSKPDELQLPAVGPVVPLLGNPQRNVFLCAMADGSVRAVAKNVSEQTLRNAINPKDGMPLGPDW
jgi:uncharacterized protein DUF1559/uncharacterized protein DUF4190